MSGLTEKHRRTLADLCDTLLPALPAEPAAGDDPRLFSASASQIGVPQRIERDLRHAPQRQRLLARLLNLLENRWLNGWLVGHRSPYSSMTLEQRTAVLNAWSHSRWTWARRAILSLRRLVLFYGYTASDDDGNNPTWSALQYPGARRRPPRGDSRPPEPANLDERAVGPNVPVNDNARRIAPWRLDASCHQLDADVLVVGSGAGGGVVAAELAAAGLAVLVAEKGEYFDEASFPDQELAGNVHLYERRGAFTTADGNLLVLAGSNVGGGTTVNWMTCLPPPEKVLRQWARDFGFQAAASDDLQVSLAAVSHRLNVNVQESPALGSNQRLEQGCRALGYPVRVIPRNVRDCGQCDFCVFGCEQGAKQDVRTTFLTDAWLSGARILPGAEAIRILHQRKETRGAELRVREGRGTARIIQVRCRTVVVAGGAIHTPAILRRSGVTGNHLGRHLHLHPTTAVFAHYDQPIRPWQGPPQTRLCDQFDDLDGDGYGVRLETCPVHPGTAALAIPWQSGRDHKRLMQQLPFSGNVIVLTRDRHGGRVRTDRQGRPVVHYRLHPDDAAHVLRGTLEALRVQHAAGAVRLYSPHSPCLVHEPRGASGSHPRDPAFEQYLRNVQQRGIRPYEFGLYSAHQLSTCRIHGNRGQGVVDPQGRVWGYQGLYVADGSVLPSSSGVNPMLTIMGLAHYLAQQIKADLGR